MELFPEFTSFDLAIKSIRQISHDSKIFVVALPTEAHVLGLRPGQHLALCANVVNEKYPGGKMVKRKYTPTSKIDSSGSFEIPIKIYYPTGSFPGGVLTTYLDKLREGDRVKVIGPIGKFVYEGNGVCLFRKEGKRVQYKKFGFIAGGSGITPCFQYIQYIIDHNEDIDLSLVYANKTENDIWLRTELERYSNKCSVFFTLDSPGDGWTGGAGFVNGDMLRQHLPAPDAETCIFFCGPKPMNALLRSLLPSLGYENFTKF